MRNNLRRTESKKVRNNELQHLKWEVEALKERLEQLQLTRLQRSLQIIRRNKRISIAVGIALLCISTTIFAFTIPNSFTAGTPTVAADVNANFNAIAGRLNQYEGHVWQLIYENDIAANTTSVTVPGLNGNIDKTYRMIARFVNASGTGITYYVRPNGDVGSAYGHQVLDSSGAAVAASNSTANNVTGFNACTANAATNCEMTSVCYAVTGSARVFQAQETFSISPGNVGGLRFISSAWNNTTANITSFDIVADAANGIGSGSHIEIWARR